MNVVILAYLKFKLQFNFFVAEERSRFRLLGAFLISAYVVVAGYGI